MEISDAVIVQVSGWIGCACIACAAFFISTLAGKVAQFVGILCLLIQQIYGDMLLNLVLLNLLTMVGFGREAWRQHQSRQVSGKYKLFCNPILASKWRLRSHA